MRIDLYTKVVLTVIAGLLGVIALRPYVGPEVVQAQGAFAGVQYSALGVGFSFFDPRTGDLWVYNSGGSLAGNQRLTRLGQPMK